MKVPDDVIILLCDDNWGNVRRLPELNSKHPGLRNVLSRRFARCAESLSMAEYDADSAYVGTVAVDV
jgi:hypothetical protein